MFPVNSIVLKKWLLIFSLFFIPFFVFSQSARTGVYGISQFPVGESSEYFVNASGGGISAEFGFSEKFGESVHIQYLSVFPKNKIIISSWQLTSLIGIWYNVSIGESGFSFQPCVEAGLIYQGSKTKEEYGKLSQRAFTDFIFQMCPSFRFKHEKFLNNHIEVELSPVWSIIPQQSGGLSFIGARLGLMYVFDF